MQVLHLNLFFLSPGTVADFGAGAKNLSTSALGWVLLRVNGVSSSPESTMFWTCTSACIPFASVSLSRYHGLHHRKQGNSKERTMGCFLLFFSFFWDALPSVMMWWE